MQPSFAPISISPLLVVSDLARSLTFYRARLGAAVEVEWETYARLRYGAGVLHLAVPGDPTADKPEVFLTAPTFSNRVTGEVVIQVEDCRATWAELERRGVQFLAPPHEPPWGGEVRCFCRDPDGHLLEFTQPHG